MLNSNNSQENKKVDALLVQLSANPYFDMLSSYSIGQLGLYYLAEYADRFGYLVKVKYYNSFDEVSMLLPELIRNTSCRDCPLTVREGRTWLSKTYPEPTISTLPAEELDDEIEKPALSLKELWFRYEKDSPDVLRGVSAEVPVGCLYAIVGGNGAGKSTTLKAVCGICRPYRGKVKVFGKPVEKYKSSELFGGCLAMLPQDPKSLFVKKTVREDLAEMTKDTEKIAQVAAICEIESLLDSHPYDLSGGEQQRSALAKVLLTEPKLLLLDEPTKGIDSFFKEKLADILCKLKDDGITIVMVSHDVEFCAKYADQVSMFFDGQILTTDTPRRFFGANSFYTTAANRMSRHVFRNAVTAEDVIDLCRQNKEVKA